MTSAKLSICIHGHFYQPPRENPWTGRIDPQPSAAPFHDWNARITRECYWPNSCARILDAAHRTRDVSINYAHISFNFGPTLLSWLEHHQRPTYEAILAADHEACRMHHGHGAAIAQVYHHLIMPLTNARDRRTQVIWGVRDFEARFGRSPEGMWLAEAAVDLPTLEDLASQQIRFTILAPHQASAVRALDASESGWQEVGGAHGPLDTSRPYLCRLPSGEQIAIFFYDGDLSRAVAFDGLLHDGVHFARRLCDRPQGLSHIATDGESYGHHHRHGEMALAYALKEIASRDDVSLTVYGEYLEHHPPTHEVRIHERTSWSCAHGIERWRSDCGCSTGAPSNRPSNQRWRAPLRDALDWLRDTCNASTEELARRLFLDPWQARDSWIDLLHHRVEARAFFAEHARDGEAEEEHTLWLELQHHLMLMYTSCGWFFHDLAGIETIQLLLYAGKAIELHQRLLKETEPGLLGGFLEHLSRAMSNQGVRGDTLFLEEVYPFLGASHAPHLETSPDVLLHTALEALRDGREERLEQACHAIEYVRRRHRSGIDLALLAPLQAAMLRHLQSHGQAPRRDVEHRLVTLLEISREIF